MWIKERLKRYFPATALTSFNRFNKIEASFKSIEASFNSIEYKFDRRIEKHSQELLCLKKELKLLQEHFEKNASKTESQHRRLERRTEELIFAEVFAQSIKGSQWLGEVPLCPGRWAAGFPFLYSLYRILDEVHPKNILELGLGQSTSMIFSYIQKFGCIKHFLIEHDQEWIEFFLKNKQLPEATQLFRLNLKNENVNGTIFPVRMFEKFTEVVKNHTFNLIVIDAPFGYDMKEFSRIDVALELPQILEKDFIILIDDSERPGEKNTVHLITKILEAHGINYFVGNYCGAKDTTLICSEKHRFLTSM